MDEKKNSILLPYISQDNISHVYYEPIIKDGRFAGSNYFSTGLYERIQNENDYVYAIIAEPLLLYDEVFITLDDFLYLTTKINDVDLLIELLEKQILRIINTESFRFANHYDKSKSKFEVYADKGQSGKSGFIDQYDVIPERLIRRLERATIKINNDKEIIEQVINESNNDLSNRKLVSHLKLNGYVNENGLCLDDLKRNRLYYLNYFLNLQHIVGADYLFQDKVLYDLLTNKISLEVPSGRIEDMFFTLLDFNDIIDIRSIVEKERLTFNNLYKVRNSDDCKNFRKWIWNLNKQGYSERDSIDLIKAYHNACIKEGKLEKIADSLPYKIITLAVTTFVGVTYPVIGGGLSAADAFKDLLIKKWRPNFFFDRLKNKIDTEKHTQK